MIYSSNNKNYSNRLMGHFVRFIEEYKLFSKTEPLLIAVSGGIDSIVLTFCLNELKRYGYSNNLRVIHINHNSRLGQDEEEKFVSDFCNSLEIEFNSVKLDELDPNRNFEYKARLKRYDAFYQLAKADEKIVLAHHIDDSFEWSLLQSLRSSNIEGLVGIPLINDRVIRPFMCLTKMQIRRFADSYDLPFITDPTNEEIKYERNFIRNNVIETFSGRYQKYLKHYVYRHNEIARRLGVHLLNKNKSSFQIKRESKSVLIYSLFSDRDFSGLDQLIMLGLQHLNPNSRGSVSEQIAKIVKAMSHNKFGPLTLTNGIKVYLDFNMLLMTKEDPPNLKKELKESKTFSYEEFTHELKDRISRENVNLSFPFFVTIQGHRLDRRNFNTTFNTECISQLRSEGINYYPSLKLLREWSKKKNRHKVLRLNFLSH